MGFVSDINKRNINALKERYSQYAEYFLNRYNDEDARVSAELVDAVLVVSNKNGESYQLESIYDNSYVLDTFFDKFANSWEVNGKLFFCGFGSGIFAKEFLKRFPKDHKMFIYEPSTDIFKGVLAHIDISDIIIDERIELYIECDANIESYEQTLRYYLGYTDFYTYKHKVYYNYSFLFPEEVKKWINSLEYIFTNILADNRLNEACGELYIENNYSNYKYFAESKNLAGLYCCVPDDIPAIIVSAGPSLSKNIKEIRTAKGRSVIIAVDAALNPLIKEGIIPDIVLAVDPTKGEKYLAYKECEEVPLICDLNTAKGYLNKHRGLKGFCFTYNSYTNRFITQKGKFMPVLQTGGSVANDAFSFALFLGCKTIIFVGQDLAFTGEKTHAFGSVLGNEGINEIREKLGENVITDIDINGNPIKSCIEYRKFKKWFENEIENNKHIRYIDGTEGGVWIKGTEIMPLKEAIEETCKYNYSIQSKFNNLEDLFTNEEKKEYIEYIVEISNQMKLNKMKIQEVIGMYENLRCFAKANYLDVPSVSKLMQVIKEKTDIIYADEAVQLVKNLAQKEINEVNKVVYRTENDGRKDLLSLCDMGIKCLEAISSAIDRYILIADDGLIEINDLIQKYSK